MTTKTERERGEERRDMGRESRRQRQGKEGEERERDGRGMKSSIREREGGVTVQVVVSPGVATRRKLLLHFSSLFMLSVQKMSHKFCESQNRKD